VFESIAREIGECAGQAGIPFDHSIGFDKDDWPNMADSTWGTNIYKHYGYTPYWEEVSVKTSTATKTAVGTVYVLL
jgi:hypothetical protein